MQKPSKPPNEIERLKALRTCELLDTSPEELFDVITGVAASMFHVPIALISLIDADRQWFKSRVGLEAESTSRDISFCGHAILGKTIFEVPDALLDPRFADNPLVTGAPYIRFYAGAPIIDRAGLALGTLCLIDRTPGQLTTFERQQLSDLAQATAEIIDVRLRSSDKAAYHRAIHENECSCSRLAAHSEKLNTLKVQPRVVAR